MTLEKKEAFVKDHIFEKVEFCASPDFTGLIIRDRLTGLDRNGQFMRDGSSTDYCYCRVIPKKQTRIMTTLELLSYRFFIWGDNGPVVNYIQVNTDSSFEIGCRLFVNVEDFKSKGGMCSMTPSFDAMISPEVEL